MKHKRTITILVIALMTAAAIASAVGVFSRGGPGPSEYKSVRGQRVTLYGYGIYRHMSAEVAVQGVGQDYITLFLGVPALGIGLLLARRGSLRGRFFLAGVLGYFLVAYLFYLVMGMYNLLFLVYAFLLGSSFFAFLLLLLDLGGMPLERLFRPGAPVRFCGGFLIVNTFSIAFLWLGVVVPPLLDGTVFPLQLEHYTTLIVQGLDLGLLLPLSFVSGLLLFRRNAMGLLAGPVYLVFLSFLMTALIAKIIAIGMTGGEIIPVVFIIPATTLVTSLCAGMMLRSLEK